MKRFKNPIIGVFSLILSTSLIASNPEQSSGPTDNEMALSVCNQIIENKCGPKPIIETDQKRAHRECVSKNIKGSSEQCMNLIGSRTKKTALDISSENAKIFQNSRNSERTK